MKLTPRQLTELEKKGVVTIQDDAYHGELGGAAARNNPPRCPDCGGDVETGYSLCPDCAARRHELEYAA